MTADTKPTPYTGPAIPPGTAETATRHACGVRFDLIPGDVMKMVAECLALGAHKYGDNNWKTSRLSGEASPINHALKHINYYKAGIPDDESPDPKVHLSHAIVNLMFELYYELQLCESE